MLGELNETQVDHLLRAEVIGRIGFHADGITIVVPITYVYDSINIYGHSAAGTKINMTRKNPDVCFEIDSMQNMANWQSVIVWGKFEEITKKIDQKQAMKKLTDRIMSLMTSETAQPTHGFKKGAQNAGRHEMILYRIKLYKKTGRFEKR